MDLKLSFAGLLVGVLVGLTGMGGGSLMTPILILLFGFDPKVAVGTDILHGAVFKTFGGIRHRMLGTVHARLTFWMLLGSAPMSLLGVELASYLGNRYGDGVESAEGRVVGAALILGGAGFLAKTFLRGRPTSDAPFLLTNRDRLTAFTIGFVGGFIVGLTSVGSGTFFGLMMLLVFPLTAQKIVGTDLFHAAALLWVAGVSHLLHGNVDAHAMAWLLVGSVPGVLLGSQMTLGVPDRALRIAFSFILVLSGIKLVGVPQSAWVIAATLLAGTVLLAVWESRHLWRRRAGRAPVATQPD
jgi:uncharacterized membrane protein YfcA